MPCNCHGAKGEQVRGTVRPDDQCVVCAAKHLSMARAAWGEFTYELSNRYWVAGHIRLAVEHLKVDNRDFALMLRDLAVAIEDAADTNSADIRDRMDAAMDHMLALLSNERKDMRVRLEHLKAGASPVDVIVPLGPGTASNNDELRILLRSIDAHAKGLGRIIIVSDCAPAWLANVEVLAMGDAYNHNKDANLIDKTVAAISRYNVMDFVWCADDNVFMQDVWLDTIPILRTDRAKSTFGDKDNIWHRRALHTFEWAESMGVDIKTLYESHAPQLFTDAPRLASLVRGVDYMSDPGLTIMTVFRVVMRQTNGILHGAYKATYEDDLKNPPDLSGFDRMFLGYNDKAFASGLRESLFKVFDKPCRYEKEK